MKKERRTEFFGNQLYLLDWLYAPYYILTRELVLQLNNKYYEHVKE